MKLYFHPTSIPIVYCALCIVHCVCFTGTGARVCLCLVEYLDLHQLTDGLVFYAACHPSLLETKPINRKEEDRPMWDLYFKLSCQLEELKSQKNTNPSARKKAQAVLEELDLLWLEIQRERQLEKAA